MKNIFVISSDMDMVYGSFESIETANKKRDYLNAHLTEKEFADHGYITIECEIDEDGNADLTNYDIIE